MRREKDGQMYFMIRYFETDSIKQKLFLNKCPTPPIAITGNVGHFYVRY
jgi:hypothetical protein